MTKATTKTEFDQLCAALPALSPGELGQLRARLQLLNEGTEPTAKARDDRDWLLRGIEEELRRRGLIGGREKLFTANMRADWAGVSERIRADLAEAHGNCGPREAGALGQLAARALADWLRTAGIPVRPKTMLQHADKVFAAIDAAFPGYVEAGLLRCCLEPEMVGAD